MMKILLVDDHQIVRDGLRVCLEGCEGYEVIGEASDGATAIQLAQELQPDAIVMDVAMPGMNGIEAAREILAHAQPEAKIICLSMHADREFIAAAFRAGAVGYLLKSSAFQELVQSLRVIAEGRTYLSPAVAGIVVDSYVRQTTVEDPSPTILTPREKQVLQLLAEGNSAKEIGTALNISHKTVHAFRSQIMAKLGVNGLPDLTRYAIRQGLVRVK